MNKNCLHLELTHGLLWPMPKSCVRNTFKVPKLIFVQTLIKHKLHEVTCANIIKKVHVKLPLFLPLYNLFI